MRLAPILTATVVATVLTLAGCSSNPAAPTVDVPKAAETAAASPAAAPALQFNERGNIVKQVGETGGWGGTGGGDTTVSFVVDKITVDPKCTAQFATRPDHGHFLQLDFRIETKPNMGQSEGLALNPNYFSTVGPDGVTESSLTSGASYMCLDTSDQVPTQLMPGSKYRGSIVLDTRNPSGVVMLRPPFFDDGAGWEWAYGAA